MKRWLHKIELLVDKIIPYSLVLLFFVIIGEIFFAHEIEPYHVFVSVLDGLIIFIFVLDLTFKYIRIKIIPKFIRKYWLEIIAIFPAFLVIRIVEEFAIIVNLEESILISQEVLEVGERTVPRTSRLRYFSRFIRPLARLPRFLKAFSFYERPIGRHHSYEESHKI